jgi:hypothetical protein
MYDQTGSAATGDLKVTTKAVSLFPIILLLPGTVNSNINLFGLYYLITFGIFFFIEVKKISYLFCLQLYHQCGVKGIYPCSVHDELVSGSSSTFSP